jgi:hypothetical protein
VELAFRRGRVHEATIQAGNMRPRILRAAGSAEVPVGTSDTLALRVRRR